MADRITIARPYARAAFEEARMRQSLQLWSEALRTGAQVVKDARVEELLDNPRVTAQQLAQFVIDVAGAKLGEQGGNFIRTLSENHRLSYLPEIAALFDTFKDEVEGVADVTVTSAAELNDAQRQKIAAALQKRLKREVRLHCEVDPTLIGGAILRSGDMVIDGSLRTRLDRIAYELTA
jgi:F-type H+-transporting ATPase subunit delta